ncbi:hypothetical protein ANCDUO_06051 [Ancylostoma duodenale]|uniref:Uncharacterized protein n=1 Tax=Ancylostoma duodenale TaxID=51022 RepID=A0A0C2GX53_9BILA|nr:hypothetical protein ANCDUO_06051 [Ancylostoma duodenale]
MKANLADMEIEIDLLIQRGREGRSSMPRQEDQSSPTPPRSNIGEVPIIPLPRIQVASFSGNSRDWENFWQLFKCNIHDQPISTMMKFNVLLEALQGDVREAVGRIQITEANYKKNRYGSDETVIKQPYTKLEKHKADGQTIRHQRKLLDQVATTMAELANKGQDIDHRQRLTQIFGKFRELIQMKIPAKR